MASLVTSTALHVLLMVLITVGQTVGTLTNLALNKLAYEKGSTGDGASRAVDGNPDPNHGGGSCTHTQTNVPGNWWLVDLGGNYSVEGVRLTNRDEAPQRLADFYIRVGETFDPNNQTSFDPTCYTLCHYQLEQLGVGETRMFNCTPPIEGRFVTVHFLMNRTEALTLCEAQVFGATLVYVQVTETVRHFTYNYYNGTTKPYRILATLPSPDPKGAACILRCNLDESCSAVQVTNGWCTLLENSYPCETADVQATGTFIKKIYL